ncbi:MAG TPA: hypothetical protein VII12_11485 [Thermoanaerobaculia bacterium]
MKRIHAVALCVVALASIASAAIVEEHPVFLNGKPFARAVMVNGKLAMSVQEFARGAGVTGNTFDQSFTLNGNTLTAKVKPPDMPIVHKVDKASPMLAQHGSGGGAGSPVFGVRKAGVISTHVFTINGKAFIWFKDVATALGVANWTGPVTSSGPINLNVAVNGDGIVGVQQ